MTIDEQLQLKQHVMSFYETLPNFIGHLWDFKYGIARV